MKVVPMTQTFFQEISQWKYDGIYSFYDHNEKNCDAFWDEGQVACVNEQMDLVGYFCYGLDARIPTVEEDAYEEEYLDIGLGLRPDLCGKGYGLEFLRLGLLYASECYGAQRIRLSVAAFNERAIKVYRKAGFQVLRIVTNSYFKNQFFIMVYTH